MASSRTLHVRCATWEQVDAFHTRKLRRGKLLSMKVPFQTQNGAQVTLGLELPNGVVIAIDGNVLKASPIEGDTKTWIEVELVGFTEEVLARLKAMAKGAEPPKPVAPAAPPPPAKPRSTTINLDEAPASDERALFQQLTAELRRLRQLAVHEVLGVSRDADADTVRIAWMTLVRRHHPDLVARHAAPAITHLAEELTILLNRAYDRLRAALVAEGRGTTIGSTLQHPSGWLVGFEDLSSVDGTPVRRAAAGSRPGIQTTAPPIAPQPMATPPPAPQGGEAFEQRARAMLLEGDANNAQEVLAAALCVLSAQPAPALALLRRLRARGDLQGRDDARHVAARDRARALQRVQGSRGDPRGDPQARPRSRRRDQGHLRMTKAGRAVGIDLGTSNSVAAVIDRDGRPASSRRPKARRCCRPSCGSRTTGSSSASARDGLDFAPDVTIFGAKRLLGRRFDHPEIKKLARVLPYDLTEAPNGDTWIQLSPGRSISPEEVCALILRELRHMAEMHFGEQVTRAVITIPAWYDAAQRQATKDAAQIAGLTVLRLLSEPTAAALGHGAHRGADRKYLVCDLGGGTFDCALVDVEGGIFEVLATTGDPFLGGDDVNRAAVENLVRDVRNAKGMDISTDAVAIERLRLAAQRAKHELSRTTTTTLHVPELVQLPSGKGVQFSRTLRRDEIELWSSPLLRRLEPPIRSALDRAKRKREEVDDVLLVGGMTRMPAVRREIAKCAGREPSQIENPEEVVAIGAALEVARLEGQIEGVLLIDVAARGIAISTNNGDCEPVLAQSAVIPTREHRVFGTRSDNQARVEFDLWEGESLEATNNRHLGRWAVVDLPEAPAGDVLVLLELTLDTDGVLQLRATELVSGERLQLEQIFHAGLPRADVQRLARQLAETS